MAWFVYLIECTDRSIYTGIAVDVGARYAAHADGKGARYTRSHPPARLLAAFEYPDRSTATRAESMIKKWSAQQKRTLCRDGANGAAAPAVGPGRAGRIATRKKVRPRA
jgi:putative endonuclease